MSHRTCNALGLLALDQYERYISALGVHTRVLADVNPGRIECELSIRHDLRHATCVAGVVTIDPTGGPDTEREIWALWSALEPPELVTVTGCARNEDCILFAGHGGDCYLQDQGREQ